MRRAIRVGLWCVAPVFCLTAPAASTAATVTPLSGGWRIESSAKVTATGAAISKPGFDAKAWHPAGVPSTVVAALVAGGNIPDPYFGMNLRSIPGTSYPIGGQFANLPMPADSPYNRSWWYRTEFTGPSIPQPGGASLHFDGINFRANVWMNGQLIASKDSVAGAYRRHVFDVSRLAKSGVNAIAVEVFPPGPGDLGINWVDWNPTPPDKNMGLWGPVYLTTTGPIALRHSYVRSTVDTKTLAAADLAVSTEITNTTGAGIVAEVAVSIGGRRVAKTVTLAPRASQTVQFTAAGNAALHVDKPRLWWPYRMGEPNLYTASVTASVDGRPSDNEEVRFGIRQATSELTPEGHRLFRINGRPILIRGGGWAQDMMLRPLSREQIDAHMRYVREMGLNTIRQEGKLETDEFYDRADELGILIMPGWCCCDVWEMWNKWDAEDVRVADASLRDQLLRLRTHPSVFVWLNGSDKPPNADIEGTYLGIAKHLEWDRPTLSSAAEASGPVSGPSGVKMRGPYEYVPPSYWLQDAKNGGAFGFATEISPGAAVPPIESLQAMLPKEHLWPIDQTWNYHAGGGEFKDIRVFTTALESRYGKAADALDYTRKAQALTYEAERAMFEGYARNKYRATGVIQWMLNNAWPSIIWHLYDYYMRPGGGYFGTKAACEPLHVQYSYDDRSIVVVNDTQRAVNGVTVTATLLDFKLARRFTKSVTLDVAADAVARAFTIPDVPDLTTTYFLDLTASGTAADQASRNFYWLSTKADVLAAKSEWYFTPTVTHADLTALATLPRTDVKATAAFDRRDGEPHGVVTLENTGTALAFQIRLKAVDATGNEILPVYWQDNYIALLPGARRTVSVSWPASAPAVAAIAVEGWNVASTRVTASAAR
jgi:exo-1,4-beta-D-glucosaminidase